MAGAVGKDGKSSHPGAKHVNAVLLQLGEGDLGTLARQLSAGVTVEDLEGFGGQFALDGNTNRLPVPGSLWGPDAGGLGGEQLKSALEQLQSRGEIRAWPLFTHIDPAAKVPVISGFVAARVARVASPGPHGGLSFTLQPCMMSTTTALIDASSRGPGGAVKENPYLCKVRIVQ
jgi:hypothetical protein